MKIFKKIKNLVKKNKEQDDQNPNRKKRLSELRGEIRQEMKNKDNK